MFMRCGGYSSEYSHNTTWPSHALRSSDVRIKNTSPPPESITSLSLALRKKLYAQINGCYEFVPSPCGKCVLRGCILDKIQCFGPQGDQTLDGGNYAGGVSCSGWETRVDVTDMLEWSAVKNKNIIQYCRSSEIINDNQTSSDMSGQQFLLIVEMHTTLNYITF